MDDATFKQRLRPSMIRVAERLLSGGHFPGVEAFTAAVVEEVQQDEELMEAAVSRGLLLNIEAMLREQAVADTAPDLSGRSPPIIPN